jgi:hypothetical protein
MLTFTKKNLITKKKSLTQSMGKRSLLQISQRQKPKRTLKNLQTITTSKVPFYLITTTTSLHRKWLFC